MKHLISLLTAVKLSAILFTVSFASDATAQTAQPSLPNVIRFSGHVAVKTTSPAPSQQQIRFRIVADDLGQQELFAELQIVSVNAEGKFSVFVGETYAGGIPATVFADGGPRWLEFILGDGTVSRSPISTVPYAFRASVAETLNGKSATSFVERDQLLSEVRKVMSQTDLSTAGLTTLSTANPSSTAYSAVTNVGALTGVDAGRLLQTCIQGLPMSGGICDARSMLTINTINATIEVDRPVNVLFGGGTIICKANPCFRVAADLQMTGLSAQSSSLQASAGADIFAVAGSRIRNIEISKLTLKGNGLGSRVIAFPDWSSTGDYSNAHYRFHDLEVRDFGATAFVFGRSTFFFEIYNVMFQRNRGSIFFDRYAEGQIHDNFFYLPASAAQITAVGTSITHIEKNTFINDGKNVDPDILIKVPADGNDGNLWIVGNKFGPENEVAGRVKIEVNNPEALNRVSMAVVIHENTFSGLGATQTAIRLRNQISYWSIQNNLFNNIGTAIDDGQPLVTGILSGHSIFKGNRMYLVSGQSAIAFKNGGRGFDLVDGTEVALKQVDATTENRLLNSERQDKWVQNGTSAQCGVADPFGTLRACRISRNGKVASESTQALIDASAMNGNGVLKFWAKAGTLASMDVALSDLTAGKIVTMLPVSLTASWKQYVLPIRGFDHTHAFKLYIYPGGSGLAPAGTVEVFGFQFASSDQNYLASGSSAAVEGTLASRFEEKLILGNQLVSNVPTGTAPFVVASTTPVANLTLQADSQIPTITSAGKIVESALPTITANGKIAESALPTITATGKISENALPTITASGKIAESALPTITSSGKISENALPTITASGKIADSALPQTIARVNSATTQFAGSVTAQQLGSQVPTGTAPLAVVSQTKVNNLNVDLLDNADWSAPAALGTTTPNSASVTTLTVTSGVANNGTGLKHARVPSCTAANRVTNGVAIYQCNMNVTWTTAFVDTNYTVSCTEENAPGGSLQVGGIASKTAAGINVQLISYFRAPSAGGKLSCIAIHD
jgi:hypothetical protein